MRHNIPTSLDSSIPASLETVHALANIYLTSAERWLELNSSILHDTVDTAVAAEKSLAHADSPAQLKKRESALIQPMFEKSMAYARSAYKIISTTQLEVTKLMTSQITHFGEHFKLPADWNAPVEMFNRSLQQFSTLTERNTSAAAEAARKTVAETAAKVSRAA